MPAVQYMSGVLLIAAFEKTIYVSKSMNVS
jgi:hypothetical protein